MWEAVGSLPLLLADEDQELVAGESFGSKPTSAGSGLGAFGSAPTSGHDPLLPDPDPLLATDGGGDVVDGGLVATGVGVGFVVVGVVGVSRTCWPASLWSWLVSTDAAGVAGPSSLPF